MDTRGPVRWLSGLDFFDTRLRKTWKDLWVRKARTLLTLTGLIIGLWGVFTVCVAWVVLSNDLSENHLRTKPPHVVVNLAGNRVPDPALVSDLPGVMAVENRPLINGRIESMPDQWLPLQLFVVDEFEAPRVAGFWKQQGAFPPPEGGFVIERAGYMLMQFMRQAAARGAEKHRSEDQDVSPHGPPEADTQQGHGVYEQSESKGGDVAEVGGPEKTESRSADSDTHVIGVSTGEFPASEARLRLPGGQEIQTALLGTVFDPGLAPSNMERIIYGYVSRKTADWWMPAGYDQRLLVQLEPDLRHMAAQGEAASRIEAVLEDAGFTVTGSMLPEADQHPHQFQMNSILFLLAGLGCVALLLCVVLVLNLVNGILTNQVRQIGSLKAIGATPMQVAKMYLASMALLGLAAGLLALPLAIEAGYGLSRGLAAMLNFDILTAELPWTFLLLALLAGCLFPVAAALRPVHRWSQVPVRAALENHGVGQNRGDGGLAAGLNLPVPLPLTLRLGLRNAWRTPRRLLLGVLTAAVGALAFMLTMNMKSSLLNTAEIEEASIHYDISVRFEQPVSRDRINWMSRFPEVEEMELWQAAAARPLGLPATEHQTYPLVAVPADSRAMSFNVVEGQWLSPSQPDGVVLSHRMMSRYPQLRLGGLIELDVGGKTIALRISGVRKQFGQAVMYVGAERFRQITGAEKDSGRLVLVTLKDDANIRVSDMIARLEQHFELLEQAGQPLKLSGISTAKIASAIIRGHLDMIVMLLAAMAVLMMAVSALGMASGIGTSVIERTRELGVLRAIGATPGMIQRLLSAESLFIALIAWFLAVLVAPPVSEALAAYFGSAIVEYPFDYRTSRNGLWQSLLVVSALALVATFGPAKIASRREVAEAVGYE